MRVDVDADACIAPPPGAGVELEEPSVKLHRVIVLDRTPVLEATNAVEVRPGRRGAPRGLRMRGRLCEAGIIAGEKPVEDALRLRERAGAGQAEFDHEAILEGAEQPLDAPFGLRRPGGDPANAQLLERAADLGGLYGALELFLEGQRGPGIAVKDPMAIGVGGGGNAIAAEQGAEEKEVAVGIFLQPKDAAQHLARGIIDRRVEHEAGTAVLEPGVMAAVHLDEEAGLGHALAVAAMPGWAAGAGTADPGRAEEALHCPARQVEAFTFGEQLGEVMIIHALVAGASQRKDPSSDRLCDAAGRGPAAVAMGEGREALLAQAGQKPTEVPK